MDHRDGYDRRSGTTSPRTATTSTWSSSVGVAVLVGTATTFATSTVVVRLVLSYLSALRHNRRVRRILLRQQQQQQQHDAKEEEEEEEEEEEDAIGHAATTTTTKDTNDDDTEVVVIEPPRVVSWIPYIGSGIELGNGILKFIRKYQCQVLFGTNVPVFTATVVGKACHFVATPEDCDLGFLRTSQLDNAALAKQFLRNAAGADPRDLYEEYHGSKQVRAQKIFTLVNRYVLTKSSIQTNAVASQRILIQRLQQTIRRYAAKHDGDTSGSDSDKEEGWYDCSLMDYVYKNIFAASVGPLFSKRFAMEDDSTNLVQRYLEWDSGIPYLFGGIVPSWLFLRKVIQGREALMNAVLDPQVLQDASGLLKGRRELYPEDDMYKRGAISMIFAAVGNSNPSVFWTLVHVLSDPDAIQAIRNEIDIIGPPATTYNHPNDGDAKEDGDEGMLYYSIEQLDRMVVIKSVWYEAIRLYLQTFTARDVVKDMIFEPRGGNSIKNSSSSNSGSKKSSNVKVRYLLKAGTRLMANMSVRHRDGNIFPNPDTFQWDRFVPDPVTGEPPIFKTKDGVILDEPVILFGGGNHKCPGRFFIEYEMKSFLAHTFANFDLRLAPNESIPRSNPIETGVGIVAPERDCRIQIRKRIK